MLLLFNADHGLTIPFTLPELDAEHVWELLLDSADVKAIRQRLEPGQQYQLQPCSLAVLRDHSPEQDSTATSTRL